MGDVASSQGGTRRRLRAGEILMREGAASTSAYRLVEGILGVSQSQPGGPDILLADVRPGGLVGELAVLAGGPRTATVTALSDGLVTAYTKDEFEALLASDRDLAAEVNQLAIQRIDQNALRRLIEEMVSPVSADLLRELEQHVRWLRLPAGETLYSAGDQGDGVFYLVSGRLQVTEDDRSQVVGRGTTLGESGLLMAIPRRQTVTAMRDSGLLHLDSSGFETITRDHLDGVLYLLRELGRRSSARSASVAGRALTLADARNPDGTVDSIVESIRLYGTVGHLSASGVEDVLDFPGLAEARSGDPAEYRLGELVHQTEVDNDHVVYSTDEPDTEWSKRCIRQSDHVAVLCSVDPGSEEIERIRSFVAASNTIDRKNVWLVVVHPSDTDRPRNTLRLLDEVGLVSALHIREGETESIERVARIVSGHGIAVVFSGGGARGFAHLGAFRALVEAGVPVDFVGGASMGAVMAGFLSLDMAYDDLIDHAEKAFRSLLDYTLPVVSLIKGKRIHDGIMRNFGDWSFADTWRPFVCVSTNLTKSRTEIHRTGSLAHAIRASIAIPGVIPPVSADGDLLVDGGVLDNLPIDVVRAEFDPGVVIALDVTPERGPTAKEDYGYSISGWKALFGKTFRKQRYPNTVATLLRSTIAASVRERDRQVRENRADLYLQMPLRGIGLLEFERAREVADAGYAAAESAIKTWWSEHPSP